MAIYTQANRPMQITTLLGPDAVLLEKLTGTERLSEPYCFQLDLLAERPLKFESLLDQPCSIRLAFPGSPPRYIHGGLRALTQGERILASDEKTRFIQYRAELVPYLWRLTRRSQSRIFLKQTVPQILKQVLTDQWHLDVVWQLAGTYPVRDHCVQYRESDFAFISRLLEDEGIWYSFHHKADGHQLVLSDNPTSPPKLAGPSLIHDEVEGGSRPEARVFLWEKTQEVRTCTFSLRDHCFEMPDKTLQAQAGLPETVQAGQVAHQVRSSAAPSMEVYDYPGAFVQRFDGVGKDGSDQSQELQGLFQENGRVARLRAGEEAAQIIRVLGASTCSHLAPGFQFTLERHFDAQGDYLLTAVEHAASLEGAYRRATAAPSTFYENHFRCLPGTLPFRPARLTPRPRVAGTQTATVVGPKGSEIFCDKYGRVKLLFRWDRQNQPHSNTSGWVRVAQASAGGQYGSIQIPRVGHEVVVDFLEGDPDQPIIVGSVYNGAHMPPFPLPANQAQTGCKTRSQPDGQASNFSGLMFDDSIGQEHVHMHSERFMTQSTEGSLFVNAAQGHYVNVGQLHSRQVGGIPGTNHSTTAGGQAGAHGTVALSNVSATSSGSGGGAAPSSNYASTPFGWNASVEGGAAADLDLIIGWNCDNTLGMETRTTIGSYRETMINAPTSAAGLVTKLLGSKGFAKASVVLGPLTEIHYGSKIQVNRGPTWTATRVLDSTTGGVEATAAATACKLLAASYSGWMVLGMLWPALKAPLGELTAEINSAGLGADATWALDHVVDAAPQFIWSQGAKYLLGLWVAAESAFEAVPLGESKVSLAAVQGEVGLQGISPVIAAQIDMVEAKLNVGNYAQAVGEVALEDTTMMHLHTCDTMYTVYAPGITLLSSPDPSNTTSSSVILIQALGNEAIEGNVLVYGSDSTHVAGGAEAYARVQTVGEEGEGTGLVTIDCGAEGTMMLQSGLAKEPNSIMMSPEGIIVSSTELVTLLADENSLTIDPEAGITLEVGESNVAVTEEEGISLTVGSTAIEITEEGITLTCGTNVVAITAEGITLSSGANTIDVLDEGIVINGASVIVSGDEELSFDAPLISAG